MVSATEALGLVMAVLDGHNDASDPTDPVGSALGTMVRALPGTVAAQAETVRQTTARPLEGTREQPWRPTQRVRHSTWRPRSGTGTLGWEPSAPVVPVGAALRSAQGGPELEDVLDQQLLTGPVLQ